MKLLTEVLKLSMTKKIQLLCAKLNLTVTFSHLSTPFSVSNCQNVAPILFNGDIYILIYFAPRSM